jgi:O-antigen/teichoic acid export membrane protein
MNIKKGFLLVGLSEIFSKILSWLSLAIIPFFTSPDIYGEIVLYYSIILFIIPIIIFGQDRLILKNNPNTELVNSFAFSIIIWSIIAVVSIFFNYFLAVFAALFLGFNKFYLTFYRSKEQLKKYAINRFGYSVIRFILLFLTVYYFYSLRNYLVAESIAAFFVTVGGIFFCLKNRKQLFLDYKNRFFHGLPLMLHGLSLFGLALVDRFILKKYTNLTVVGNYSFIYIFASGLIFLYSIISILQEKKIYLSKNNSELFFNVKKTLLMMFLIGFIGCIGSIAVYNLIFKYNLVKDYTYYFDELLILLLAHLILPIYLVSNYILIQKDKGGYLLGSSMFALLVNVAFNMILIPTYGLQGAVLATLISNIMLVFFSFIVSFKVVKHGKAI